MSALTPTLMQALRAYAPFDEMEAEALDFLVARLAVAYYPRGEEIVGPSKGAVDRLYIVRQGKVRGTGGPADVILGPGESFPIGALLARRATVYRYGAEVDTFCWELEAKHFHTLVERSARFHAFCTRHLAMLVERSHRALHSDVAARSLDYAGMLAPLRSVVRRGPVFCDVETPLGEVLATMNAQRIGSMVVADRNRVPIGIFTTVDVLRTAAEQRPPHTPVGEVMTRDPVCLEEEASVSDAALAMSRHAIRHVVVTRDGKLAGVVSERDLFALQRVGVRRAAEQIDAAQTTDEFAAAAGDIRRLMRQLLAQGLGPESLTAMVSGLNDRLTMRVIELAARRHALPEAWCWLALGSEGRMEQTFVTDQDNALIFTHGAPPLLFADEVNRTLDAAGFPLCKGDIMARNPLWCLSAEEWQRRFDDWIRNNDPQALLHASIFFDFRPLAGEARLAGALRDNVLSQTRANRAFCRAMAESALTVRPPLGLLTDFSADALDLKMLGARPFIDAARVFALASGSPETNTAARLRAAAEPTAAEAFHYIQAQRLRREGNVVRVQELTDIDRRVLKAAFRQAAVLQQRLRLDYAL